MENAKFTLINTTKTTLSVSAIMQYLHSRGISADCVYAPKNNDDLYSPGEMELIADEVRDKDIVGFSSFSISEKRTLQLMKFVKDRFPEKQLIVGGPNAIMDPERLISEECVDAVCIHEGEIPLEALINEPESRDIPGVWFKGQTKPSFQKPIQDLDEIPFINFKEGTYKELKQGELVLNESLVERIENPCMPGNFLYVIASRGCPNSCSYCINDTLNRINKKTGSRIIRKRNNIDLISDLNKVVDAEENIENIFFFDDDFMIRSKTELEEFAELYKEKIGLPFYIFANPNSTTREKIDICYDAGLKKVEFGLQTVSADVLHVYNRKSGAERIKNIVSYATKKDYNLEIAIDFISNSPFENEEDVIANINYITSLDGNFTLYVHNLHLFPGSKLRKRFERGTGNEFKEYQNNVLQSKVFNEYATMILMAMQGPHNIEDNERFGTLTRQEIKHILSTIKSNYQENLNFLNERIQQTDVAKFYKES